MALRLLRDDGAIVYINGSTYEFRTNMPAGPITSATSASSQAGPVDESRYYQTTVPASAFVAGSACADIGC